MGTLFSLKWGVSCILNGMPFARTFKREAAIHGVLWGGDCIKNAYCVCRVRTEANFENKG